MTPLPFDPDVDGQERRRPASSPFSRVRQTPWRRFTSRLSTVVAVAGGGVVGGCARYGVDLLAPSAPDEFPWATLTVNLAGSFLLGLLLVLILEVWPPRRYLRPFLAVGLIGSFTTFSTWMVEFDQLLAHGAPAVAAGYLAVSVLGGVSATSLGLVLGRGVAAHRTHKSKGDR
jgi:fluoride exporter